MAGFIRYVQRLSQCCFSMSQRNLTSNVWFERFQVTTKPFLKSDLRKISTSTCLNAETPKDDLCLTITETCVKQLKEVASKDEFLRVSVDGGGCSGFTYRFELDKQMQEEDRVFERDGVKVVSDEASLELIKGSSIDYEEELIKSAFRLKDNPQSSSSCSCGVSFSID